MQKRYIIRDRCILLFALLIFSIGTYSLFGNTRGVNFFDLAAYQHRIKGMVTDSNGIPIQGVNVEIKGSSGGTFTDKRGVFYLEAAPTDVLILSYIGFKSLEVVVGSSVEFSLVLEEDVTDLGAVTVNAGYYTVSDKERTGSISSISAADIEEQPVTNVLATMQGRMPGVFITQDGGVPGSGFQIQIRGQNSLRTDANVPLYVIDGVPYSAQSVGSPNTSTAVFGYVNPLNSIDPSLIGSIEVLKDADATAIYGSRGANGVVLITTKRGKSGKTRFQLGYSYGTGRVHSFMELMHTEQYIEMRKEAFSNDGITQYPTNAYDVNGTWDQDRYTDWQEVLIGGTSEYTDINGSISGGNQYTQFSVNGNYHKETTVYSGDFSYHKTGIQTSLNHKTKDGKFGLQLTASYTLQQNHLPGYSLTSEIFNLPPNTPALYNEDGSLNWENSTWVNPLSGLNIPYHSNGNDLVSSGLLSYELLPGFSIKTSLGFSNTMFNDQFARPSTSYDPAQERTSESSLMRKNSVDRKSWIVEPQLSYSKDFKNFKTELLVGGTFQNRTSSQLVYAGLGFTSNSLMDNIAGANRQVVSVDDKTEYRYNALFGRLNFNLFDRYIINLTGRRDGSSRFGPGNRFANFGALGLAWLFSEEPFVQNHFSFISFGKLRFSYGTTGSDLIGDYQYLDTYSVSGKNYAGISVLEPSRLYNPSFSWEENKKMEVALETGFLKDRLFLTTSYYRNLSSNQLVGIPLAGTTGFSSIQANLDATVENKGWEFSFRSENFRNNDFFWSTSFNLSINNNKLLSFPGLEGSTYTNSYVIGKPLNIKKLYQYEGLDTQNGLYQFTDFNSDGALTSANDREVTVDINPQFYGGLANSIKYKGLTLDFLFQFVKQQNYSGLYLMGMPGEMNNNLVSVEDRWQQPGDQAKYQPYSSGTNAELRSRYLKYRQSNAIINDASYIRLKTISLSYKLPDHILNTVECSIILRGQNLFTITGYDGFDPESGYINTIPPLSVMTTGIQLNF